MSDCTSWRGRWKSRLRSSGVESMKSLSALALCLLFISPPVLRAETGRAYYVDPDWSGTSSGAPSAPWTSLASAEWATINAALETGDVTVFFSAREAGADVDESTTVALAVLRSSGSPYRLTLDGSSQYNANDTSPSWSSNTGNSRFRITAPIPVSSGFGARSYVTVRGFRLIATQGQIVFWWGGSGVTIEDNDGSSSKTNTYGPGIYYGYTNSEGTACPSVSEKDSCVAFSDLIIRGNYVHDTFGEGIYIGGCANTPGCLSHRNVTIQENRLRNVAIYGGEPDAIDLKDGLRNVVVRGNDIRLQRDSRAGISTESGAIVEKNYVEGAGWAALVFSAYWNNSGATRRGAVARNNILVNSGGNAVAGWSSRYGVYIDGDATGDAYSDVGVYSNTIYRVVSPSGVGDGIWAGAQSTVVMNNIVAVVGTLPLKTVVGGINAHANNLFYQPDPAAPLVLDGRSYYTSATLRDFEPTGLSNDPEFLDVTSPYAPTDFGLKESSKAAKAGVAVNSYDDDFFGLVRSSTWDLGAVQSSGGSPRAPANVKIVRD